MSWLLEKQELQLREQRQRRCRPQHILPLRLPALCLSWSGGWSFRPKKRLNSWSAGCHNLIDLRPGG
jgi:hypothetical protein